MRRERILITGAFGFLGANLFKRMSRNRGLLLHLLDRAGSNWRLGKQALSRASGIYEVDLLQLRTVRKVIRNVRPDFVFHVAAAGVDGGTKRWPSMIKSNIIGTTNLLQALRDFPPSHFIQMGTCFEYGSNQRDMRETDPLSPLTIYSASKVASTFLALTVGRALGIPVTVFRAFTLYGPYDNPFRLVSWVILSLFRGETGIQLTKGKKAQVKDFLFVDDFATFLTRFIRQASRIEPYQIFNIGHNQPVSVAELVTRIGRQMDKPVSIIEVPPSKLPFAARVTEYGRIVSDYRKAAQELGWKPQSSLQEGLTKTIAWFRRHQRLYSYD